ncbi:hypothetical protein NQ314_016548 [Rhamnusium bicolor]|uniref:Uncharacterized protein n=1 Tax=Rhamnusium bicolor TaxID=1586634 RepID=A0AAV8WW64_9CUCU|nr:hypothetical protein NQ314_016548 [Rhamnusium bicolor]
MINCRESSLRNDNKDVDSSFSATLLNDSVKNTELNLPDNEVPPRLPLKKVQIIEDWLLGVESKCIYAIHQEESILEKKKNTQLNEVVSQVSSKQGNIN